MENHRDDVGGEPICKHLPIALSTLYDQLDKRANPELLSARAKRGKDLRPENERVWEQNYTVYGVRAAGRRMARQPHGQ